MPYGKRTMDQEEKTMKAKIKTCPYKNIIIGVLCGVAAVMAVCAVVAGRLIHSKKKAEKSPEAQQLDEQLDEMLEQDGENEIAQ